MSTLADEGFLSDEVDAVVTTVHGRYGRWFSELQALNKLLVRCQYSFRVRAESARELACATLYIRALVHCQAAVLLIERGMDASARAMIRCVIEALFQLGACAKDPAAALAFVDADEVERKRRVKYLQQVQDSDARRIMAQSNATEILADSERRIEELDAHRVNVREMARVAGLEDTYLTAYAWLCGAVHSSARDLEQHFELTGAREIRALVNEPAIDDLRTLCLTVGEMMVLILQAAAPVFALDVGNACRAHLATLRTLGDHAAG